MHSYLLTNIPDENCYFTYLNRTVAKKNLKKLTVKSASKKGHRRHTHTAVMIKGQKLICIFLLLNSVCTKEKKLK